ncbi:hypothetical protein HPB47_005000, partial [Ixodes persulcatus]
VEGTVTSLRHLARRDVTEITVSAARVHRDSPREPAFAADRDRKNMAAAVLERPLKCGTKAGKGHFLFLGVRVLGKPTLRCAPRLKHWRKLRDLRVPCCDDTVHGLRCGVCGVTLWPRGDGRTLC